MLKDYKNTLLGLTLLCVILLAASAYLFLHDAAALERAGYLRGSGGWHHAAGAQPDPLDIHSWMTFDFINEVFQLPPEYLKSTLSISASSYPRVTIRQVAKMQGISETVFLQQVQQAVASFRPTQP